MQGRLKNGSPGHLSLMLLYMWTPSAFSVSNPVFDFFKARS